MLRSKLTLRCQECPDLANRETTADIIVQSDGSLNLGAMTLPCAFNPDHLMVVEDEQVEA